MEILIREDMFVTSPNKYLSSNIIVYFQLGRCDPFNSGNSIFVVNVVKETQHPWLSARTVRCANFSPPCLWCDSPECLGLFYSLGSSLD